MEISAAQSPSDRLWDPSWEEGEGERTIAFRSSQRRSLAFYGSWFCPFVQRVWIALEEKGVDYQYIEINPYEVDEKEPGGYTKKQLPLAEKARMYPDFVDASPQGLVPALDNDGETVCESLAMIEYIDERFKGEPLLPANPWRKARARVWATNCGSRIQSHFYTMLIVEDEDKRKEAREKMLEGCRALARDMAPLEQGPYFLGQTFSIMDIALAPFWQRYIWVGKHYRDFEFPTDEPEFERLEAWWDAVCTRPSVARTFVCKERLISSYSHYAQNKATSDYAKKIHQATGTTNKSEAAGPRKRQAPSRVGWVLSFLSGAAVGAAGLYHWLQHSKRLLKRTAP